MSALTTRRAARRVALSIAVGCTVALVIPSLPASAAAGPTLSGLRISRTTASAYALRTDTVMVSMDITDPDGVRWGFGDFQGTDSYWTPTVVLKRTSGSGTVTLQNFQRVSGTDTDGTWAATWPVTSADGGTWEVVQANLQDAASNDTHVDPRTLAMDPQLTVTTSWTPALTYTFTPAVLHRGDALTVSGTFRTLAGPLAHEDLWLPHDEFCGLPGLPAHLTTNSNGGWSTRVAIDPGAPTYPSAVCVYRYVPANGDEWNIEQTNSDFVSALYAPPRRQYAFLSRSVAHASVPVGTADAVSGSVWPFGQFLTSRVLLQRLVGRTWRTVGFEPVRASGRFTLTANPPNAGRNYYRVVKNSDSCASGSCAFVGVSSAAFVITAT